MWTTLGGGTLHLEPSIAGPKIDLSGLRSQVQVSGTRLGSTQNRSTVFYGVVPWRKDRRGVLHPMRKDRSLMMMRMTSQREKRNQMLFHDSSWSSI
jgi:hypothetical protein